MEELINKNKEECFELEERVKNQLSEVQNIVLELQLKIKKVKEKIKSMNVKYE